jgi:hypothetical protein
MNSDRGKCSNSAEQPPQTVSPQDDQDDTQGGGLPPIKNQENIPPVSIKYKSLFPNVSAAIQLSNKKEQHAIPVLGDKLRVPQAGCPLWLTQSLTGH